MPIPNCTFFSQPSGSSKPLIVVVGWMGAQQRHLDKYLEVYKGLGHDILSIIPTPAECFVGWLRQRKVDAFIDEMRRLDVLGRESVFHVMSNNGGFFNGFLCQTLLAFPEKSPEHQFFLKSTKLILDCCPSRLEFSKAFNAFAIAVRPPLPVLWILALMFYIYSILLTYIWNEGTHSYWERLAHPQKEYMTLYSQGDVLITQSDVEEFMSYIRERGCTRIQPHMFEKAPHVQILRSYPEEYTKNIREFLNSREE